MGLFGGGLGTALGAGIGFAIGGPSGAAWGAGLGAGVDTNADNAQRADSSNAWSAAQYASRYKTTVNDLESAGLNPMLAYSQGAGSAPTAQAVQFQNPVSSASQSLSQYAGAEQSFASASQAQAAVKQIDATVDKIKSEIKFIDTDEKRLHFVIENLYQQNNLLAQQGRNEVVREKILEQTVNQLLQENLITSYDVKAMKDTNFVGRVAREMKPLSDIGTDVIDSLKFWKGKTIKESGTTYDRNGRESGGFSRERHEK